MGSRACRRIAIFLLCVSCGIAGEAWHARTPAAGIYPREQNVADPDGLSGVPFECRAECSGEQDGRVVAFAPTPPPASHLEALRPGLRIDTENAASFASFLTPAIEVAIARGLVIELAGYQAAALPPPLVEATHRYSCNATLDDGGQIRCYVAGLPFPRIDDTDRYAAAKHMYNHHAAASLDDLEVRDIECDAGSVGPSLEIENQEMTIAFYRLLRLAFFGRTMVAPFPSLSPNPSGIARKQKLGPISEPFDKKGDYALDHHHRDQSRQTDTWLYLPQKRRVRRCSTAQRSNPLFGLDLDLDSFDGFDAEIAWSGWKDLGAKTVVAPLHGRHFPVVWGRAGKSMFPAESWEPRRARVIQGTSLLPSYQYAKRVIYLDLETYRILYSELYDRSGELWKLVLNGYHLANEPFPSKQYGETWLYAYLASMTVLDLKSQRFTRCAWPSALRAAPGPWVVNAKTAPLSFDSEFEMHSVIASPR